MRNKLVYFLFQYRSKLIIRADLETDMLITDAASFIDIYQLNKGMLKLPLFDGINSPLCSSKQAFSASGVHEAPEGISHSLILL